MDIEKIKKYAQSEFDGFQIKKAVTAVKNEIKDNEQERDLVMSDYFKTLREPLIEQQKKTDEKQDKVIEQLKENELAMQDIITLNRELPQLTHEEEKYIVLDIENDFNNTDRKIIGRYGLNQPKDLKKNKDDLTEYKEMVEKQRKNFE